MTRGKVIKQRRRERMAKVFAYVLYNDEKIMALICRACRTPEDINVVPIHDQGTIKCLRCEKVA